MSRAWHNQIRRTAKKKNKTKQKTKREGLACLDVLSKRDEGVVDPDVALGGRLQELDVVLKNQP